MSRLAEAENAEAFFPLNVSFDMLLGLCPNLKLVETYNSVARQITLFRWRGLRSAASMRRSAAEHAKLVDVLCAGDWDKARNAFRKHVMMCGRRVLAGA
jgi:DNA-binding GntR family transcriptional regulator